MNKLKKYDQDWILVPKIIFLCKFKYIFYHILFIYRVFLKSIRILCIFGTNIENIENVEISVPLFSEINFLSKKFMLFLVKKRIKVIVKTSDL